MTDAAPRPRKIRNCPHWKEIALAKDKERLEEYPKLINVLDNVSALALANSENFRVSLETTRRMEAKVNELAMVVRGNGNGNGNGTGLIGEVQLVRRALEHQQARVIENHPDVEIPVAE